MSNKVYHAVWSNINGVSMWYKLSGIAFYQLRGGLEIPVEVTICTPFNSKNKAALGRFELLLAEPVNGKHEDVAATILEELESDSSNEELWFLLFS